MKYLAIDYGTKRIGLAVSDGSGTIVRTYGVVKNTPAVWDELKKIIKDEEIEAIVVGLSLSSSVSENTNDFIARLTLETMLPIEMVNEDFSSFEAHGRQGKESLAARKTSAPEKPDNLDARAAAVILERYLDKKQKKSNL